MPLFRAPKSTWSWRGKLAQSLKPLSKCPKYFASEAPAHSSIIFLRDRKDFVYFTKGIPSHGDTHDCMMGLRSSVSLCAAFHSVVNPRQTEFVLLSDDYFGLHRPGKVKTQNGSPSWPQLQASHRSLHEPVKYHPYARIASSKRAVDALYIRVETNALSVDHSFASQSLRGSVQYCTRQQELLLIVYPSIHSCCLLLGYFDCKDEQTRLSCNFQPFFLLGQKKVSTDVLGVKFGSRLFLMPSVAERERIFSIHNTKLVCLLAGLVVMRKEFSSKAQEPRFHK